MKYFLILIFILSFPWEILRAEEVIVKENFDEEVLIIQAVATNGRTFAVRRGFRDGVSPGQESLFTSGDASFRAIAKVVNRHFSMWEIKGRRGGVTFKKGDFVTFTNNIENVLVEVPKYLFKPKKEITFRPSNSWILKGHYSYAMSESVSETDSDRYSARTGFQFEGLFARKFYANWEWAVGVRFDRENATLESPQIDVPTQRSMGVAEIYYHFDRFNYSKNNAYMGIGLAYGFSNTTVDEAVSAGTSLVLPSVKVGYINRINPSYSFVLEASFEAISTSEAFADTEDQNTSILNSKLGIGIRF